MNKQILFYIIITGLKSFFCIILMKIQALVISCDKFLYVCIEEICLWSIGPVFDCLLHFFIAADAYATQKLLPMSVSK
jgi:hypothetical protein